MNNARLRFGAFLAPYHPVGQNPTLALERDLQLVEHLDRLGYDELYVGEHHSAGMEIISAPDIFIGVASQRTRHIKLGTGVIGTAYHNPLWVAERLVLLDHLTRGRVILGLGPGGLPTDGAMIGVAPADVRPLLEEGLRCIVQLLRSDEPVDSDTSMWRLRDAQLQLRPYSDLEVVVSAVASPSGPRLAGRHGIGMLSIGATQPAGFEALAGHWSVVEQAAAAVGGPVPDRSSWRLVGLMHLAPTRAQAEREVAYGIEEWFSYFQTIAAVPQVDLGTVKTVGEMIDYVRDSGLGVIGTPDEAVSQIERLRDRTGGFGAYLTFVHEWADPEATKRSYELLARHVFPQFQGQASSTVAAAERAQAARQPLFGEQLDAHEAMVRKHEAEGVTAPS